MQDTDSSDTEDEDASEAEIDGKAASKAKPDYDDENAREIDDMIRGLKSESPEPPRVEEEKVVEPAEEEDEEEDEEPSIDQTRSPSPPLRSPSPEESAMAC